MVKFRNPGILIVLAIFIGLLVLVLSGVLFQTISMGTGLFEKLPFLDKTFTHTSMLVLSIILILIVNKGKLKGYGFFWNMNFPMIKIVSISLIIGFVSYLIGMLVDVSATAQLPMNNFSIIEKIVYIWFWASICEEVFTRGLIQGFLSPVKNIGIKIFENYISLPVIVSALFFGAMHLMLLTLGVNTFLVLNIVFFGIILGIIAGYQREQTNSLVPAIIVHLCFNVGGSILQIFGI